MLTTFIQVLAQHTITENKTQYPLPGVCEVTLIHVEVENDIQRLAKLYEIKRLKYREDCN